jgi:FimV-like protein
MPKKLVFGLILSCFSIGVQAINLGSLNVISEKNQPLKAELDLGNLSESELRALRLEFSSSDNTDLKSYGIQSTIEKKGKTYFAKIITQKPLPVNVLDLRVKSNINGQLTEKTYSNLLKGSQNKASDANDIIKANPVPVKQTKTAKPAEAPVVSGSGKYVVKDGDSLYSISGSHSKSLQDVSLDQVIVAIYQSNPQAFNNGNMNRLRSGSELSLPTSEQASNVDQKSAKLEITARTTQYSKYRNKVINFVNKRAPESEATTSQKGSVTTQSKQVEINDNAKDNLKIQKSGAIDKKEQEVAKALNNQESKEIQEQNKLIQDSKKELEDKKQLLSSATESSIASKVEDTTPLVASSTNVAEDEKHANPLGLPPSSAEASSTESKPQGTITTTADVASKTQLEVKSKNTGVWPFLIMLVGAGGIGYWVYKRRKKQEQEEEYDSLFVHNSKSNANVQNINDDENDEFNLNSGFVNTFNKSQQNSSTNFLQNTLNNQKNEHKDGLDDGLDGDFLDFNLGSQETFSNNQQNTSKTSLNNSNNFDNNDDHLFADNIPLIDDFHKDDDLFKDNQIGFADDSKQIDFENNSLVLDAELPNKNEVQNSIEEINFDDIPELSMEDEVEQTSQIQDIVKNEEIKLDEIPNLDALDIISDNNNKDDLETQENVAVESPPQPAKETQSVQSEDKDNGFYETKLELAKAYLDIEDFSGASMLLEELAAQNEDKKVQKQAKALLKDINEI